MIAKGLRFFAWLRMTEGKERTVMEIEMKIDLHIHAKTGSDGNLSIEEVFQEVKKRNINLMSITNHDSIDCQERAIALAKRLGLVVISSDVTRKKLAGIPTTEHRFEEFDAGIYPAEFWEDL